MRSSHKSVSPAFGATNEHPPAALLTMRRRPSPLSADPNSTRIASVSRTGCPPNAVTATTIITASNLFIDTISFQKRALCQGLASRTVQSVLPLISLKPRYYNPSTPPETTKICIHFRETLAAAPTMRFHFVYRLHGCSFIFTMDPIVPQSQSSPPSPVHRLPSTNQQTQSRPSLVTAVRRLSAPCRRSASPLIRYVHV